MDDYLVAEDGGRVHLSLVAKIQAGRPDGRAVVTLKSGETLMVREDLEDARRALHVFRATTVDLYGVDDDDDGDMNGDPYVVVDNTGEPIRDASGRIHVRGNH